MRAWEEEAEEDKEREAATKRVRAALFKPFDPVPAAQECLSLFTKELDRYPFLVVLARSGAVNTEWAMFGGGVASLVKAAGDNTPKSR